MLIIEKNKFCNNFKEIRFYSDSVILSNYLVGSFNIKNTQVDYNIYDNETAAEIVFCFSNFIGTEVEYIITRIINKQYKCQCDFTNGHKFRRILKMKILTIKIEESDFYTLTTNILNDIEEVIQQCKRNKKRNKK